MTKLGLINIPVWATVAMLLCTPVAGSQGKGPSGPEAAMPVRLSIDSVPGKSAEIFHFGVPPTMSPTRLEQVYGPTVVALQEALQQTVAFGTKTSLAEFGTAISAEEFDILLINFAMYLELAKSANYIPIARRNRDLKALIVSRKESELDRVDEVHQFRIGSLPRSAMTTRLMKSHLQRQGICSEEVGFQSFEHYTDCMMGLMLDQIDACVTAPSPLKNFSERLNIEFKTITETSSIPDSMVAVHRRVSASMRSMIKEAMLGLTGINSSDAFVSVSPQDLAKVERLLSQ